MRVIPWALALLWLGSAAAASTPTLEVEIKGVDGALRDNALAFLSLKRHARSAELDEDMVGRLVQRAEREVSAALRPFGFYQPTVTTGLTAIAGGWRALVHIERGPPIILVEQRVEVTGPGREQPFLREVLERVQLVTGTRLSHPAYDELKGELQRTAASHGYLDAHYSQSVLEVDPPTLEARARLTLETGERYQFGASTIEQDFLDAGLVRRYLRYQAGDWYDAGALLRTQFALDDSRYFAAVEVMPEERDPVTRLVPIRIRSEPGKRNVYRVAAGYATDTRARATLGWDNRRLNSRGHRLSAELRVSDVEEALRLSYTLPWADPALEKLSFELRALREQRADVETTGATFRAVLTQVRGRWQRAWSITALATRDEVLVTTPTGTSVDRLDGRLLVPGVSMALLPAGFLGADAVPRGLSAELLGSTSALGSDTDFIRLLLRDDRRYDLAPQWRLLLRGELGSSAVGDFSELPARYRFFAGGDRSVRGYAFDELSPVDADGNHIGGRHLLSASVEVERELGNQWAVAAFVDAGSAFDDFGESLEYSAGLGIRYRLPFLSIGLDVAQSISEPERKPRLHLNFTPEL